MLYNVTYPHSRDFDSDVPEAYLDRIAKDPRFNHAVAVNTDADGHKLQLVDGKWVDYAPPVPGVGRALTH